MDILYCKNILVTSTILQLSQLHVYCTHLEVQEMLLNKSSSFQKSYQLAFPGKGLVTQLW